MQRNKEFIIAERAFCLSQRRFCFCKNANSQTKDLVQRAPSRSIERERPGIRSADLMLESNSLTKSTGKFTCAQSAYHFLGYDSSYEVHTVGFESCIIGSSETSSFDFIFDRLYSFLPPHLLSQPRSSLLVCQYTVSFGKEHSS